MCKHRFQKFDDVSLFCERWRPATTLAQHGYIVATKQYGGQ